MKFTHKGFILLFLLALSGFGMAALAQSPVNLSPLQFLPGDASLGPAAFDQQQPFITRGGDMFLAVWTETRTDAGRKIGSYYDGSGSDIYAARLDANGNVIDSTPLIITQSAAEQNAPQVAWNGQNWLVVWLSQEPTQFYWAWQVMAARVSPQGVVLDSQPIPISNLSGSSSTVFTVDSDGSNWTVIWEGSSSGETDVMGTRISPDGVPLDPGGVVILPGTYYIRSNLDVAFAQDEYLLTWQAINIVQGIRLGVDLQPMDAAPFDISPSGFSLADSRLASNGTDFFVIWEAWRSSTYYDAIQGGRVTHGGQILDPNGIDISGNIGPVTGRNPRVEWDGTNWFTAYRLNGISITRISPNGAVLDPGGIAIDSPHAAGMRSAEVSRTLNGGVQAVWTDSRAGGLNPDDIYTARVSASNTPGPAAPISFGSPSQDRVTATATGNGYLLVFRSDVSGERRIMAQPVDANGNALLAEPVLLASGKGLDSPAVAGNGSLYLAVWSDTVSNQIYGRRLLGDGSLVDAASISILPGHDPDVAALGENFLVVGVHTPSDPHFQFPFSARVRGADGAVLDAPVQVGNYFAQAPTVTAIGGRWLAVWERHPSHDDPTSEIQANFVDADGVPGTEFSVRSDFYSVRFHYNPAVAASGNLALVVWEDPRVSNSDWNIYGRRLQADGTLLDSNSGIPIVTAPKNQGRAALAWDGSQFVAAYEDMRAVTFFLDRRTDIFATRVDPAGQVLDPDGFAVFNGAVPEIFPAVAGANGQALLTGAIYRDEPLYAAYRAGLRISGSGPFPPTDTPTATSAATATATLTPSPTATSSPTPSATPTPTSTTGCVSNCLRSANISLVAKGNKPVTAVGKINVRDENNASISDATVDITWTLPDGTTQTQSSPTDTKGTASFSTSDGRGTYTLTVTHIAKTGYTFDPTNSLLSKSITK
ncbi:MAG: Ig-like domain-containing protein [Anaerolineae bacterium]